LYRSGLVALVMSWIQEEENAMGLSFLKYMKHNKYNIYSFSQTKTI